MYDSYRYNLVSHEDTRDYKQMFYICTGAYIAATKFLNDSFECLWQLCLCLVYYGSDSSVKLRDMFKLQFLKSCSYEMGMHLNINITKEIIEVFQVYKQRPCVTNNLFLVLSIRVSHNPACSSTLSFCRVFYHIAQVQFPIFLKTKRQRRKACKFWESFRNDRITVQDVLKRVSMYSKALKRFNFYLLTLHTIWFTGFGRVLGISWPSESCFSIAFRFIVFHRSLTVTFLLRMSWRGSIIFWMIWNIAILN